VTPKDYFGLELVRRTPQASDEQIEHALKHKQDELSQFKKVEGRDTVTERDAVVIKFEGTVGEHKVEHQMMLDLTDQEHEPLPGISAAVVGLPIGTKDHEISWSIPADHPRKELAGREAKLKVTLNDVKEKLVPKLDDDFAKDTGEAQTLEELKQKIRDKIVTADQQKAERELREQALKELRKRNPLEVSGGLVDRQLDNVVERVKLQLQLAGVDIRNLEESKIREDLREVAADEVRGTLLLEAIAETEKVAVGEADLRKRLAELASLRGTSVDKLRAEYLKEGRLDALKHALREELTLDLLLTRATIKDEVKAEEK
jgi:trigger factor